MRVYIAGTSVAAPKESKVLQQLFKGCHKLHSYYHSREKGGLERRWWRMNVKNKVHLFLDSGAFSAWTQGVAINLDDYIQFCLEHLDIVDVIVNLDVIPGRPYQKLTSADIEESATQGWANYEKMLDAGIPKDKLIHIFHQGEDMKWLKRMVKEIPYIGISPANDKSTDQKMRWLDHCMQYVCDSDGMPLVKFHGFAVTSLRMMLRYPWYSVDSTTWVVMSRNGQILVPRRRGGDWVYDEDSWKISVSSRSPDKKEAGQHIDTLSPRQRQVVLDYLEEKGYALGQSEFKMMPQTYKPTGNERWAERKKPTDKTAPRLLEVIVEPGVINQYRLRDELNIIYFQDLEKTLPVWPWPYKPKGVQGFSL
ncbi:MAG: hypothetical protein M0R74_15760 [Dehalococcoidia bacterium]|nr:hypothetical protein [Dehalococcoidia bacterium]